MAPLPFRHAQLFPLPTLIRPIAGIARSFSTASRLRASAVIDQNHYETLQIPYDASPGQIKKQFYTLSKLHHPDLHPKDPDAPNRFHRLNDAYTVLSSSDSRSKYDRHLGVNRHSRTASASASASAGAGNPPSGSYSSATAGGRSPSGLSRRRATFRGPPPSFYQQGAWGAHAKKRAAGAAAGHAANNFGAASASDEQQQQQYAQQSSDNSGKTTDGDAAHEHGFAYWNRTAHFRSQSNVDARFDERRRERSRERAEAKEGIQAAAARDAIMRFIMVGGILGIIIASPVILASLAPAPKERKPRRRKTGEG